MTINDIVERYPIDVMEHAERIMNLVRPFGKEYMIVALLHDILEDTDVVYNDLLKVFSSYNSDIVDDIFTLTRKSNQTYFEYIDKITKSTKRAKIIKYYDILDHLNNKETLKPSLKKRYLKAKELLEEVI
ncbi:MAG: hypothetical protein IKE75_00820 [Bacilli bacterium]|nr:hypothetical protein [Bacilli bacterium]